MSSGKEQFQQQKETLHQAVRYFSACKVKVAVKGNVQLQASLNIIRTAAQEAGLQPEYITILLNAAASGIFAQTVSRQLIRCLIPSSTVPQEAVVNAISWMCTNKPPLSIQSLLLRWILVVYDYIDGYDKLHTLYGILFLFLDSQLMLPHICHLLFLLTRKDDVKLFRVRKILSLINGRCGPQSCLIGLLTIYKLYYPNLVSFVRPTTNKMFFGSFDRNWKSLVRQVAEKSRPSQSATSIGNNNSRTQDLNLSKSRQTRPPPRKKQHLELPISHSASVETDKESGSPLPDVERIPFTRIDTFINMLDHIDRIDFPSQIAACLRDPILQHVVAFSADKVVAARFNFWLQHTLTEEYLHHTPVHLEENEQLLKLLVDFIDFLQEGIPVVDKFVCSYLHIWNGLDYGPMIFRLISRSRLYPFHVLNDLILEPLRLLFFSSSVYFKCQCILSLTELLHNYAACESKHLKGWSFSDTPNILLESSCLVSVFPERLHETVHPLTVMQNLSSYISRLAVLALQLEGNNCLLLYSVVFYIELLSEWNHKHGVVCITLPSEDLVRRILFSSCSVAISRLCWAFCRYKVSILHLPNRSWESVSIFNKMLVDICDALWRNKVFSNQEQGSLKVIAGELTSTIFNLGIPYPNSRFSIFQGQAFIGYAWKFLLETQPEGKRVHPNQLKTVKDNYLQFLQQQHLTGILKFINTFILRKSASTFPSVAS